MYLKEFKIILFWHIGLSIWGRYLLEILMHFQGLTVNAISAIRSVSVLTEIIEEGFLELAELEAGPWI